MLKKDLIIKQPLLADLSEDQIAAIEKLSENDERLVMNEKTGVHAQGIEDDVLASTGIPKVEGETYFQYMNRAFSEINANVESLEAEKVSLTEKIDEIGADGDKASKAKVLALETALQDAEDKITAFNTQVETLKSERETEAKAYKEAAAKEMALSQIAAAKTVLNPKAAYDKDAFDDILQTKVDTIFSTYTPEIIEGEGGVKMLQWRDASGKVKLNESNANNPFTTEDLVLASVDKFVEPKLNRKGTGGKPKPSNANLSNAASKDEARQIIEESLAARGIATSDPKYRELFNAEYGTPEIAALPLEV